MTSLDTLWRCAYRSQQAAPITRADLAALLRESQMRNVTQGLTGLLLHADHKFLHLLEGPEGAVRRVSQSIALDARHVAMEVLFMEPASRRLLAMHPMAFIDWSSPMTMEDPLQRLLKTVLEEPAPLLPGASTEAQMRFWEQCAKSLPT